MQTSFLRTFSTKGDSLAERLSFFILGGAVAGTFFCGFMNGDMKTELGLLEESMVSAPAIWRADLRGLFVSVLTNRLSGLFFIFLIEMTAMAPFFLSCAGAWLGFSTAVMVSALTMEAGIFGIFRYFLLIFPQCLLYLPVLYLLFFWMPKEGVRVKPASAMVLTIFTVAGAAVESFISPWLVAMLL